MEGHTSSGKEHERGLRGRFMDKLRKEKKAPTQEDVDEFLHGPSDKLHMMPDPNEPANLKSLTRIETNSARRWPTAAEVQSSRRIRGRSVSPKRSRKGLVVRFTQEQPEVIGEGGDEATSPVLEIGVRKRAHSHPPTLQQSREQNLIVRRQMDSPRHSQELLEQSKNTVVFQPQPIQRTQTGFESIPEPRGGLPHDLVAGPRGETEDESRRILGQRSGSDRRSFAEIKADMQSGEGLALVKAASNSSIIDKHLPDAPDAATDEISPQMNELYLNTQKNVYIPSSPGLPGQPPPGRPLTPDDRPVTEHLTSSPGIPVQPSHGRPLTPDGGKIMGYLTESPEALSRAQVLTSHEAAIAGGDEALQDFTRRISHLFTLFRLSTESIKPLPKCTLEELVRAALWWFLKGRLYLETAVRDRPSTPQSQQNNFFVRQQAYADLAKSLWITETITSQYPETQLHPGSIDSNTPLADILNARQGVMTSLRKLTMSMKRNNFLPPDDDDVPLTQGLDTSIWVQDDGNPSLVTSQRPMTAISLSETFPLGDTTRTFHFGRMFVEAVLLEEAASQQYRCPVIVSIVRGQKEKEVTVIVASQDGSLSVAIQTDKNRRPTWEDVRWQSKHNTVEVKLPRGFVLRLHCSEHEFRTLWGIYDYEKKTRLSLLPHPGEDLIFETVLRTFHLFDQGTHSAFPKEPQPHCYFRLFEKTTVEKAATGPRTMHRGFRIGLNTNSKTKSLRGIDQDLLPGHPIQFGFLRGEGGFPALLLKIKDGRSKYTMVSTFEEANERARIHALLTGTSLGSEEDVVAEAPLKALSIVTSDETKSNCLQALEWERFRFINQDHGDLHGTKNVLSENLRVVIDFKGGSITDRINVRPGELKVRLDVNSPNELKVLRQPQQDMTVSVSESQVSKELPQELAILLENLSKSDSTRTYTFSSTKELHMFQAALTGFHVLFDSIASSFNISRRRMVVPIYKKWDAVMTRLQVVQKEKVVQLVAFFENFSHGDCMNFTIKSTDTFESSGRSGKYSLRIVDAKFAMPKKREGETGIDHEFVCLDIPEYPGEHDDITIVFDNEADREALIKALPAPVKAASRMVSVRR